MTEGPPLEALTHRLAETPSDFLAEPLVSDKGAVDVAAVVSDLIRDLGGAPFGVDEAAPFTPRSAADVKRLRLVLIASWLLHDAYFIRAARYAAAVNEFLQKEPARLTEVVDPAQFVTDPDRREELVRLAMRALDLRPQGESEKQSIDRLATLDSVERVRVIRETRAAQERIRQVQEAMRKKAAEEAAAAYGRE
jgi:hypothetical protein